jgi:hypothetical protein
VTTPDAVLRAELRRDGARPFITWYAADSAARVELSVATTANWVAKAAGYLVDERGIEPGDRVSVAPALHWLTAVVLLAGWAIGADVAFDPTVDAERIEVPLDPIGIEFSKLVAAYPDDYRPADPTGDEQLAVAPAVPAGVRVLTTMLLDRAGVGYGLLSPLGAGGSVVYAAGAAELETIARAERVTHTAGVDLPGLPRLG